LLQKILRFLDYIIKGSYKVGENKHIFTDQELYEEYNLTDEEINIIESVIKERK
jgi:translation elongation factor P/translation initiation factor 5A